MSRNLPVIEIFGKSLSLVWERRAFALAISWPYLLVTLILIVVGAAAGVGHPDGRPELDRGLDTVSSIANGVLLAILAVYWHRNILLQETEAPAVPLRLDGYVRRYIGYGLLLVLVVLGIMLPMYALGFMTATAVGYGVDSDGIAIVAVSLVFPLTLLVMVAVSRLGLVLPAAAVGDRSMGLRRSWRITRGNTWRLVGLQCLLIAAPLVAIAIVNLLLGLAPLWLPILVSAAIGWAVTLVGFAVLSLVYAWFRHQAPPADAEMPD